MKLSILQESLSQAVGTAARSASLKASLPILNHLLLSTDQGRLKVAATNLEIGVSTWAGAKVTTEGSLAVPARPLQELVTSLPPGKVDLEVVKGSLHVSAGNIEATLAGIDGSEFPAIPAFPKEGGLTLPARDLAVAVEAVTYAAAAEEGRPALTGVLWRAKDGALELVATDGYRLAHKKTKLPDIRDKWQALIPARSLAELARVTGELAARPDAPDEVKVVLSAEENQVSFAVGPTELVSRLIEGEYPKFEEIIPQEAATRGIFGREELVQAVRLASIFSRDIGNIVKFSVSPAGLELAASTAQLGEEKTKLTGQIEGEEVVVAFNSRYLLDALTHFEASQVSFEIKSALAPGVWQAVGDDSLLVLVMPVRMQG